MAIWDGMDRSRIPNCWGTGSPWDASDRGGIFDDWLRPAPQRPGMCEPPREGYDLETLFSGVSVGSTMRGSIDEEEKSVTDMLEIGGNVVMNMIPPFGPLLGMASEAAHGDEHKEEYAAIDKVLENPAVKAMSSGLKKIPVVGSIVEGMGMSYDMAKGANEAGRSDSGFLDLFKHWTL